MKTFKVEISFWGERLNKKFKIIIVGLGKIGFNYDEKKEASAPPRSHLVSALNNKSFSDICGVEIQKEVRETIQRRCQDPRLTLTDKIPSHQVFDVGVICTPSAIREEVIKQVIKCGIKVLIVEKPLSLDLEEALRIKELVEKHNIAVRINFHRRLDSEYLRLKSLLFDQTPTLVTLKYCKGILNYGTHFIDFLIDWFGEFESIMLIGGEEFNSNRSLSFSCKMKSGLKILAFGLDEVEYDLFEVDIFYLKSLVSFKNGGMTKSVRYSEANIYNDGYSHLGEPKPLSNLNNIDGLMPLYTAIAENLSYGAGLPGCDMHDAIYGLKVIHALEKSAKTGRAERVVN